MKLDESDLGPVRQRAWPGRGAAEKTLDFGALERDGVHRFLLLKIVLNQCADEFLKGRVYLSAEIAADGFKGHDGLVKAGFSRHHRIDEPYARDSALFSESGVHTNGIESF
ncbi:MAG: hypothetical protein Q4G26_11030 [Paracoccus sp. (in: a-proteobacteria)]|nr:hypothetical protein [Paracoccus sp. (in: a-proteobacteria)]